jgi:hypothetical protein
MHSIRTCLSCLSQQHPRLWLCKGDFQAVNNLGTDRVAWLFCVLLRLLLVTAPGYLHPSEFFQGPEPIAGACARHSSLFLLRGEVRFLTRPWCQVMCLASATCAHTSSRRPSARTCFSRKRRIIAGFFWGGRGAGGGARGGLALVVLLRWCERAHESYEPAPATARLTLAAWHCTASRSGSCGLSSRSRARPSVRICGRLFALRGPLIQDAPRPFTFTQPSHSALRANISQLGRHP